MGIRVDLKSAPLLMIVGEKGFLMCGFLNIDAADRLGEAAAVISGVSSFDEMLEKPVKAATSEAEKLGIKVGMPGREALELML